MTLLECVFHGDDVGLCDLIVSIFTTETTITGVYQLLRVLLLMKQAELDDEGQLLHEFGSLV